MFSKQVSPGCPTVFLISKQQRTKVPGCYTCRTLPKFIIRLTEFTGQGNGPPQVVYLQTEHKKDVDTHPHTHTHTPCKFRSQEPVVLRSHRIQATGFIPTLINQLKCSFSTNGSRNTTGWIVR
jgi:hypothetical protein